jgi:hypothetical protein
MPTTTIHHPHDVLILPALLAPRVEGLTLVILADGNRRGSADGGYARGARRVVAVAEHLAARPDVATMVACILSPENVARRGEGFFCELYKEFVRLGVAVEAGGALVGAGIAVEIGGDLGALRARGGHAAAVADAALAVAAATARVQRPRLRLVLMLGYDQRTTEAFDADIILRTGMEEDNVLRLSGLSTHPGVANHATTTLWPDLSIREIDDILDRARRHAAPRLARGHAPEQVIALAEALARAEIDAAVRVTMPTAAPAEAIERLNEGPLRDSVVRAAPPEAGGEFASVLAPGQRPPSFLLPAWLPPGHANVHGCAPDLEGLVEGVRGAVRFVAAHPPLFGGDRPMAGDHSDDRDEQGDRFTARMLDWASAAGLVVPGKAFHRAATNYLLTAFFMHFRVPAEWDPEGTGWEARAELAARYMMAIAAGDDGVFDRVVDGETAEQRMERLEAAARFLRGAIHGDAPDVAPAHHPDAARLTAIATTWREVLREHAGACLPEAARSFVAGLDDIYAASVAEHRAGTGGGAIETAPPCVRERFRALEGRPEAAGERATLAHLARVRGSIAAGPLFRIAALSAPAAIVTRQQVALLHDVTALLDYAFRLANDVSGFLDASTGDRDLKQNACMLLVPDAAFGTARAAAVIEALATCRRLSDWLAGEVRASLARLAEAWPWMGAIVRRAVFVGRRVYEVGHYTTVSRAGMSAIFDEASAALDR